MNKYKRLRLVAGLTKSEAGTLIGVDASTIFAWEKGTRNPKPGKLKIIADVYECELEDVLSAYEAQD